MTIEEMKRWIDTAPYKALLERWRYAPSGSPWFQDEIGDYYSAAMARKRAETPHSEQVRASKEIDRDFET